MKNQLPKPVLRLVSIAVFSSVMFAAAPAAENPTHNQQAEVDTLEFKGRLEDFNKQTYVNKALSNSISKNDYLPLVVAEFVVSRVEKFPKIHEDQLRLEVNEVIASYNQELSIAMSGDNYKFTHQKFREIKAGVATAAVSKVAAVPVAIFHGVTEAGISAIEYVWGPIAQFNAQKENGPKRELLQANAPEIFAKLKDLSTKYDVVRNVDRDIISQYTSVFTQSNGFEVMKNDVAFANDARMQNFIKKVTDEGGNISEESKKELFSIIEARFVENNKLIA